jgi:type I restriction enzyme R subunit
LIAFMDEGLNERFGTDLTDKLLFDQFEESLVSDEELSDQAQNNSIENFRLAFDRKFLPTIVTRMEANSDIFKRILDDDELWGLLGGYYLK